MDDTLVPGGDFVMSELRREYKKYTYELKKEAVNSYLMGKVAMLLLQKNLD